ncbi:YkvA family protein [Kaistella polysaccharea]|uniref:YkvA family protein n=1 Tax=Kaistella polysaccharea TaxID=2878534 RepID=UPI001CF465D5|nr:YkvA family protein [Kaistella polysaccharea]
MKLLNQIKEKVRKLKAEIQVLIFAYSDKRTPLLAKLVIGITVGYLLSPIDLIPDFIPILGLLDDLIIVPLLIMWSIRLIPPYILVEARKSVAENPRKLQKTNWIFAIIVLSIWIFLLYFAYQKFGDLIFKYL